MIGDIKMENISTDVEDFEWNLKYLAKGIKLDPDSIKLYNEGNALGKLGQDDDAIRCYDKALDLDSNNDSAWYNKGTSLVKLGRLDEAITCFDNVLELDPKDASAWNKKALTLCILERYDESIIYFDKALELDPDSIKWYNKGHALRNLDRFNESVICFDKALEFDPNYELAKNERKRSARFANEKKLDGKTAYEWYLLGCNAEDPENQVECFTKVLELDSENYDVWIQNGISHIALENYDETVKCFAKALQINPNSIDDTMLTKFGCTFGGFGDKENAIWCFTKAIEINPHNDESWYWKGYIYTQLGKYEDAFECFDNSIRINIQNDKAWDYKGYVLGEMGEIEQAIDCYNKSIEINPNDADYWSDKAIALNKLGKLDDAFECLEISNKLKGIVQSNEQTTEVEKRTDAEKINKQISSLNSEINRLTKDRTKKFSEAGEMAYSKCIGNAPELTSDAQTELDNILAIETLISKTNQEMEKAKGGQKKSGFLAKLGDAVSSTAKQGKMKVELYNLGRKKNNSLTDFGAILWKLHKNGDETFQELSDIWQAIGDIEQQIHKKEEEIDNLNKLLG